MIEHDYKVWIGVEQRLDGLTGRYGPDLYIRLVLHEGDEKKHTLYLTTGLAKTLARGLTKAVKQATS